MQITTIEQFKEAAYVENGDMLDFYILLAGGLARSSKRISYHPPTDTFNIVHEIDESFQEVESKDLGKETLLLEAIEKGALFSTL